MYYGGNTMSNLRKGNPMNFDNFTEEEMISSAFSMSGTTLSNENFNCFMNAYKNPIKGIFSDAIVKNGLLDKDYTVSIVKRAFIIKEFEARNNEQLKDKIFRFTKDCVTKGIYAFPLEITQKHENQENKNLVKGEKLKELIKEVLKEKGYSVSDKNIQKVLDNSSEINLNLSKLLKENDVFIKYYNVTFEIMSSSESTMQKIEGRSIQEIISEKIPKIIKENEDEFSKYLDEIKPNKILKSDVSLEHFMVGEVKTTNKENSLLKEILKDLETLE
jgi:hypothetical protein